MIRVISSRPGLDLFRDHFGAELLIIVVLADILIILSYHALVSLSPDPNTPEAVR